MNRSRLVVVLVLLLGAVLGARLLQRGTGDSPRALDRALRIEDEVEAKAPADLAAPSRDAEPGVTSTAIETTRALAPQEADRVALGPESLTDLVVRVVDTKGEPVAGLPLKLQFEEEPAPLIELADLVPEGTNKSDLINLVKDLDQRTNAKGRATFVGLKEIVASLVRNSQDDAAVTLLHQVTFKDRPTHVITPADLEQDEIVTVQPDYGTIRGIVLDHDRRPNAPIESVSLQWIDDAPTGDPFRSMHSNRFGGDISDGTAVFSFVELGQEWAFIATRGGEFRERTQGFGPTLHGEEVEMTVQYGAQQPILQYRVLGPGGFPYASASLKLQLRSGIDSHRTFDVATDERGVFLAYLNLTAYSVFEARLRVFTEDASGLNLEAVGSKLQDLSPGINDLGTLQLEPPAILAQGIVVNESGKPIEGATVRVGVYEDWEEDPWWDGDLIETKSDAYGRFEIKGAANDDPRGVWAFHGESRSKRQALAPAGTMLTLTLRQLPTCTVEVELGPGIPADQVRVELVHTDLEGEVSKLQENVKSQEEGVDGFTSSFTNVLPRTYDVRAVLADGGVVLAEVLGIEVRDSGLLTTFDLTEKLFLHSLRMLVRAGSGSPPTNIDGSFAVRPATGSDGEWSEWRGFNNAKVEIATVEPRIDVRVMPKAFRGETVEGLHGIQEIELRDSLQARCVLDTSGELPKSPYSLQIQLTLDGQEVGRAHGGNGLSDKRREVIFDLPAPGTYQVAWTLFQAAENFAIEGPVLSDHVHTIEVADSAGEQVIHLPLDGEALTELTRNPPWD